MERKFYPDNFEKFLKGHADQFKMTPSKKVWHGIYNDLHPGRRWPSVAVTMIFIITLVIVGHLNTNNSRYSHLYDLPLSANSNLTKPSKTVFKHPYTKPVVNNAVQIAVEHPADNSNALLAVVNKESNTIGENAGTQTTGTEEIKAEQNLSDNQRVITPDKTENLIQPSSVNDAVSEQQVSPGSSDDISAGITTDDNKKSLLITEATTGLNGQASENVIPKLKKINPVTWTFYIAPSVSYRSLSDNSVNNAVVHKPILGYEAGTAMSFNIFKKLQFTTGVQLNYSGYRLKANTVHPVITTLILNNQTGAPYSSYSTVSNYGNRTGSEYTNLKNYSLQASLPIGLQYVFAESDNIKFGAAAAFQPSLTLAGNGYLLSTDKRNYLRAPDLFRTWNMNTNLTTYVSFASNSYNWQIGPQVRYQILSSYTNRYPVKEHLINYGIRVGISKNPN